MSGRHKLRIHNLIVNVLDAVCLLGWALPVRACCCRGACWRGTFKGGLPLQDGAHGLSGWLCLGRGLGFRFFSGFGLFRCRAGAGPVPGSVPGRCRVGVWGVHIAIPYQALPVPGRCRAGAGPTFDAFRI